MSETETQKLFSEMSAVEKIVSICMHCKKIKIDEGRDQWISCMEYITELQKDIIIVFVKCDNCNKDYINHSFNHSSNHLYICPICKKFLDIDHIHKPIEQFIFELWQKANQRKIFSHGYCPKCAEIVEKELENFLKN